MRCNLAYIVGVLHGDGYLTAKGIGLTVADRDFAEAFCAALNAVTGRNLSVTKSHSYWRVAARNTNGCFDWIADFSPVSDEEKAHWLRGFFDSEGNAHCSRVKGSKPYITRRISMYGTDRDTIRKAEGFLTDLGIRSRTRKTTNSASHKGTLAVFEVALRGCDDMIKFGRIVGSSISRKRVVFDQIAASRAPAGHQRRAQALGATVRRNHNLTVVLPRVLSEMRLRRAAGETLTHRNCIRIEGYEGVRRRFKHAELVAMVPA